MQIRQLLYLLDSKLPTHLTEIVSLQKYVPLMLHNCKLALSVDTKMHMLSNQ